MENITTGHWIFASIFLVAFIAFLFWSYRKDLKLHKLHYNNSIYVIVGIVLVVFLFYVFKQAMSA